MTDRYKSSLKWLKQHPLQVAIFALIVGAVILRSILVDESSTEELVKQFKFSSSFDQVDLAEIISRRDDVDKATKRLFLSILNDEMQDVIVRGAMARALARLDPDSPEVQQALIDGTSSRYPFVRIHSTKSLGLIKKPTPEIINTLYSLINDDHDTVRLSAATIIAELGADSIVPEVELAESEIEQEKAEPAVIEPATLELALADLRDPESSVRISAVRALVNFQQSREQRIQALIEMLNDPESSVAAQAAQALGKLKAQEATWQLLAALADQDQEVKAAAAEALKLIPREKVELEMKSIQAPQSTAESISLPTAKLLAIKARFDSTLPNLSAITERAADYPFAVETLLKQTTIVNTKSDKAQQIVQLPQPIAEPIPELKSIAAIPELALMNTAKIQLPPLEHRKELASDYPDLKLLLSSSIAVKSTSHQPPSMLLAALNPNREQITEALQEKEIDKISTDILLINTLLEASWSEALKLATNKLGVENKRSSLEHLLSHSEDKLKTIACIVVAQRGFATTNELEQIKTLLLNSTNPHTLAAAAWALAELPTTPSPQLEQRLGQLIQNKDYWVRLHAARALGRTATQTAQELLKQQG